MAAANSSKGALITWTVVSTVFGITCMVLAIFAFSKQGQLETELDNTTDAFGDVATRDDLTSEEVRNLRAAKQEAGSSQLDLFYAISQGRTLAGAATGADSVPAAQTQIADRIAQTNQSLDTTVTTLDEAAQAALNEVQTLQDRVAALEDDLASANTELQATTDRYDDQVASLREEIRLKQEEVNEQIATAQAVQTELENLMSDLQNDVTELAASMGDNMDETLDRFDNAVAENSRLRGLLDGFTAAVGRQIDTDSMTTQPDGSVIRPPGADGRLTVDLGRRNGVTRGMTFSVYDQTAGVPKLEGDPEDLASIRLIRGKGSIELVSVGETSSEARIVALTPGQRLREGDLIANLAYDRNSPRRFYIYGEYDFNGDGLFSESEGREIGGLIEEFGGETVDGVTVDTDIVVLGRRPQIPQYTREEQQNVVIANNIRQAEQDLREYEAVRREAQALGKTIVNQNQLLALIGYYENALR
jgi:hypothetical protein